MSRPDAVPLDPDLPSRGERIWAHRNRPDILGVVALGGAAGTMARYEVGLALTPADGLPVGTLLINVSGSFLLAVLTVLFVEMQLGRPGAGRRYPRSLLATGFTGAFTTMSTFVVETDLLVRDGRAGTAAVYLALTVAGGLAGTFAGLAAARTVPIPGRS